MPHRSRVRRFALVAPAVAALAAAVSLGTAPAGRAAGAVGFTQPVLVDQTRAGGEPGIIHSTKFGTLVYSSHEGTTHIDRVGLASKSAIDFACPDPSGPNCYENHVWVWTSTDNGATWTWRDEGVQYTGFSDPDLTEDAAGNIYDTGIDLANDSLFSSSDGGVTWPNGTAQCHDGDRPWLAGGVAGEVFLTTDTNETGHTLFHSSNSGNSCDSTGIADNGTMPNGDSWSGFGKGVYDRFDRSFIEPAQFTGSNGKFMVGISRLPKAADAFNGGSETFQPVEVAASPGVFSPFGVPEVISMDSAQNLYFAWDTDERDATGTGGCSSTVPNSGGGPTPKANRIMLEIGKYVSPGVWQWQPPISLAHQGNARVLWPWSVAGSPGNLSVVWYQMDKLVDPDCDIYNGSTVPDVRTYIYDAHVLNALDPSTRQITVTNASGREIHQGGICDSGTTCVASGQDRRLGDYFESNIDANGCVIIASGDTTVPDTVSAGPRTNSLPIFLRQNSGPSLTGKDCANPTAAAVQGVSASPSASPTPSNSGGAGGVAGASTLPNTAAVGARLGAPVAATVLATVALGVATARRKRRR